MIILLKLTTSVRENPTKKQTLEQINKAFCYAEQIAQITAGKWTNEVAETSKQIHNYSRCVAESFQADQFAQIHCRQRIHAGPIANSIENNTRDM